LWNDNANMFNANQMQWTLPVRYVKSQKLENALAQKIYDDMHDVCCNQLENISQQQIEKILNENKTVTEEVVDKMCEKIHEMLESIMATDDVDTNKTIDIEYEEKKRSIV